MNAFFSGLVRINKKLNIVTTQLSVGYIKKKQNLFLGEITYQLIHKPTSLSKTEEYDTSLQSSHCGRNGAMEL